MQTTTKNIAVSLVMMLGLAMTGCGTNIAGLQNSAAQASGAISEQNSINTLSNSNGSPGQLGSGNSSSAGRGRSDNGELQGYDSRFLQDQLTTQRSGLAGHQTASGDQVGGTCGTMYGQPVVAGSFTSCAFAMEVAMLATAGTHPQAYWPVVATSSITGKTYTMSCGIAGPADRVWCIDTNGTAEVTVGPGAYGSWNHLVDY